MQLDEALGRRVVERVVLVVGGQRVIVQGVGALAAHHGAGSLVELELHGAGHAALRGGEERVDGFLERREPLAVVHALRPLLLHAQLEVKDFALQHQILKRLVRLDDGR